MSRVPADASAALAPVRSALRAAAETEAASIRSEADTDVRAVLTAARREADEIRRSAAAEGAAVARSAAALRSARARREAHETVLAQQESLRVTLLRQVKVAATALRDDPRYPALVEQLTERCRALLGPEASVSESTDGGVVAEAGSRRVDLSLPVLAAQALDSRPEEVRRLWTS